jgi:hypothetical protein
VVFFGAMTGAIVLQLKSPLEIEVDLEVIAPKFRN